MIAESRAAYNGVSTRVLSVPGGGTPIVLLHGYADSADTWRGVLARLESAGRPAIAVDLPGFGHADDRQAGPLLPQFDRFADALIAEMGCVVLVGNSLGAATGVRAAARNTDAVKGLVALDDPIGAHHWVARLARRREVSESFWSRTGRIRIPPHAVQWATRRYMVRALYGPGVAADPQVISQWTQTLSGWPEVARLGRYAFQYAYETRAGHHGIQVACPSLIVHGARDRIIPVYSSRKLHQQIPGSRFVVLPRSGHCPQLDDPAEVVRLTLQMEA